MVLTTVFLAGWLAASEAPGKDSAMADYYSRTGHPQSAAFYRQAATLRADQSRSAQQMVDFYQRTGFPLSAEFYRQIVNGRKKLGQ
jgi:hypothetical protein